MNKSLRLIVAGATLLLVACSRAPLDGAVYVIKGSGDITRAASIDVRVLPFSSVQEFNHARSQLNKDTDITALNAYQESQCASFSAKKIASLRTLETMSNSFSPSCAEEIEAAELLKEKSLSPTSINLRLKNNQNDKTRLVKNISETLEQEANDAVLIRFDYDSDEWGRVVVSNTSKYWVTTGLGTYPKTTASFVDNIRVNSCGRGKPKIAPKASWVYDFGSCVGTSEGEKLIKNGAKVCKRQNQSFPTLCMDDFGVEKYNSSVLGRYEKGRWVFAYQEKEETRLGPEISFTAVDFNEIALRDSRVTKLDEQSRQLKLQLKKSTQTLASLSNCKHIDDQITDMSKLTCPAVGTNRGDLSSFVKTARGLGVSVADIPARSDTSVKEFAQLKAVAVARTNVDGVFTIDNPPEGAFLLHATYRDNFNEVEWLVPVKGDVTSIELNNSNAR